MVDVGCSFLGPENSIIQADAEKAVERKPANKSGVVPEKRKGEDPFKGMPEDCSTTCITGGLGQ